MRVPAMVAMVKRMPSRPASMIECRFAPKPRPTTEACRRSFVAFDVVLRANGCPIVSAIASPIARAIGGDAHGVRQKMSAAMKSAYRSAVTSRSFHMGAEELQRLLPRVPRRRFVVNLRARVVEERVVGVRIRDCRRVLAHRLQFLGQRLLAFGGNAFVAFAGDEEDRRAQILPVEAHLLESAVEAHCRAY